MKKLLLSLPIIGPVLGYASACHAASSTVFLDPPDMADLIDGAYNAAQPFYDAILPWLKWIIGILILFAIIRMVIGTLRGN
jgi:hypothetical protein